MLSHWKMYRKIFAVNNKKNCFKNVFIIIVCVCVVFVYKRHTNERGLSNGKRVYDDYLYQIISRRSWPSSTERIAAIFAIPKTSCNFKIPITWDLPWFFGDGIFIPSKVSSTSPKSLWPGNSSDDRIVSQLMFVPDIPKGTVKKIYLSSVSYPPFKDGINELKERRCPVWNCVITASMKNADAVVFKDSVTRRRRFISTKQIWIVYILENPLNIKNKFQDNSINWTATYRTDSELVTPYAKWVYYDDKIKSKDQRVNYALGKDLKVAWIVSNCRASNRRMEYALELGKHIRVDIFGSCGHKPCPKREIFDCFEMLSKRYKFYLSFENGNCIDYITEKFYYNGLRFDVIPIVMGARKEDYEKVAPFHSYLHVEDFEDAKSLADYLHVLDSNDSMYNSYFSWKGTGEFVNTRFFCRLCAMLNQNLPTRVYKNFTHWWNKRGICVKDRWD